MRKQILILLGFSFSLIASQQNEEIGSVEDNANPNELTTRAASMRRVKQFIPPTLTDSTLFLHTSTWLAQK